MHRIIKKAAIDILEMTEKKELEDLQDSVDPGICLYERGACPV